ncbi:MAG: NnrU family protein [Parvibaculum sp.]|uniref:NnrU family protein n=2 Tax=Parvibaculum sp. TaxID=2024848 RepID=UPI0032ECD735
MLSLWAAAAFFLGIHLVVAGSGLRGRIVGAIGERAWLVVFSLASIGGISWLAMSFNEATAGPNHLYWVPPIWTLHIAPLVMLVATFFAVVGITTPNPTAVGADALAEKPDTVKGMLRITRHPFLWGAAIWALWHIVANGDRASIIFFGTFALLAILGTFSIDDKKKKRMGEAWTGFAAKTSNLPFAAIFAGRNQLKIGELGWWRILLALIVFGGLFYAHLWLFGVSPVPGFSPY